MVGSAIDDSRAGIIAFAVLHKWGHKGIPYGDERDKPVFYDIDTLVLPHHEVVVNPTIPIYSPIKVDLVCSDAYLVEVDLFIEMVG